MKLPEQKLSPVKLYARKTLGEVVYETMRDAIITQVLKPGDRLLEVRLATEMEVSRTPVRDAIQRLELEGLVVIEEHKGACVTGFSVKDIHEVYELRSVLESLAVNLAVERITDMELNTLEHQISLELKAKKQRHIDDIIYIDNAFHNTIYQAAHNRRLMYLANILQEQIKLFRTISLVNLDRSKTALEEHEKIVEAFAEHNSDLAEKLIREHIKNAENAVITGIYRNHD